MASGAVWEGSRKRVLVTGSSGFIGHHLVARLIAQGLTVIAWDRVPPSQRLPNVDYHDVDLLDRPRTLRCLAAAAPVAVLHLAARTDLDGHTTGDYASNVAGTLNLLDAIRVTPAIERVICTSSQLVHTIGRIPAHDRDFAPTTAYGESKAQSERLCREADGGGVPWCIVRPTTIWGPGMNPHYVRFFRMIRDGRYWHISGGPRQKSYGYVGNTVWQYWQLLRAPAESVHRRVFYLADYQPLSLEEWADAFQVALGGPAIRTLPLLAARVAAWAGDIVNLAGFNRFPFNSFRLRNVLTTYQFNLSSTRDVCGDLPFDMHDGVLETVRWLQEQWGRSRSASSTTTAQLGR
jgi:nucleoside-diphosphate-sugar epimerase